MKKTIAFILALVSLLCSFVFPEISMAKDELKNTDPDKYYVELDTNANICTVYEKDDNGEYTRVVRCFLVGTGKKDPHANEDMEIETSTPTPTGVWKIGGRERFGKFANFSEYARYWTQLVQDIYFHSVMFKKRDLTTITSGPYGSLGGNVSHGCIRCLVEDAKWMYYYACPGTTVRVFNGKKTNKALKNALKRARSAYNFKEYKVMQANFFDTEEMPNDKCWVTHEDACIRKESKKASRNIQSLDVGEELEVLIYNDAWVKVRSDKGREGYVFRGYVSLEENKVDTIEDATIIKATTWLFDDLDDDQTHRICKVPTDTTIKVLERYPDTKYTKIEYCGEQGYVQTKYLRTGVGLDRDDKNAPTISGNPKAAPQPTGSPAPEADSEDAAS